LLGFATILGDKIGILEGLKGDDFDRVLAHEKFHLANWDKPEYFVRDMTRTSNYSPNKNVSYTK